MKKRYISGKIHGISVTDKSVCYHGSVTICRELMKAANIDSYESVDIVNLTTGARWTTYVIPTERAGTFSLNGGGARLGEIGDKCVVMSYVWDEKFNGSAKVVFCDEKNHPSDFVTYENS